MSLLTKLAVPKRLPFLLLIITLTVAWIGYGRFFWAQFSYAIPSLRFGNAFSLPQLNPGNAQPATLSIEKLGIQAPIIRDIPINDQLAYDAALRQGVALAQGTAPLEAASGNSFIFGHSSLFTLHPTQYDTIFALLPKLEAGDELQVQSAGRIQTYTVTVSHSVSPSQVDLYANTGERRLTLITCWPIGTSFRRWVVQAVPEGESIVSDTNF